MFSFASRMQIKRIYYDKQEARIPEGGLSLAFPGTEKKPTSVNINRTKVRAKVQN